MPRNFIDKDTGEILKEPEFVKLYIRDLCHVKGVTGRQMDIFIFMLSNMNDYNEVTYGKRAKERFISEHKSSNASFNNSIKGLIDSGLIQRIGKGEFRVNKKYAVKVEWSRVQKIIWTTEYTKSGKTERVEINEADDD